MPTSIRTGTARGGERVQFDAGERGGSRQHGVAPGGEVRAGWQQQFVWNHASVFEASAIRHHDVRVGDQELIEERDRIALGKRMHTRFHDRARRAVADHDAALLQLDDAGEDLSGRA